MVSIRYFNYYFTSLMVLVCQLCPMHKSNMLMHRRLFLIIITTSTNISSLSMPFYFTAHFSRHDAINIDWVKWLFDLSIWVILLFAMDHIYSLHKHSAIIYSNLDHTFFCLIWCMFNRNELTFKRDFFHWFLFNIPDESSAQEKSSWKHDEVFPPKK